jgi:hypothetical protein
MSEKCSNARFRDGRQHIKMLEGGGLKRPRSRLGCSATGEEQEKNCSSANETTHW